MKIVATFDFPNSRLLSIKYDGEKLDALEKLQDQWSSTEYLRAFFTKFQKDYYNEYGKSDRAQLVKQSKKLAAALFEKLYEFAQRSNANSPSGFFKPLDNREAESDPYELQKLKAKGEEWRSYLRIYGIKYRDTIIVTGGAIKLTKEMRDRTHTKDELNKLESVRRYLDENNPELIFGYLDIE